MQAAVGRANSGWAEAYFISLLSDRRRSPAGDGLSAVAAAHDAGQLSDDEALGLCIFILATGTARRRH